MGKISRRRLAITSAAIILSSSAPFTIASSFASGAASAPSLDATSYDAMAGSTSASSLSTAFSCGSRWTKAQTCSTLCPTGDDDACPPGQYCYGGIPCEGGESSLEEVMERQARMEQREMDRLVRQREEEYVNRFVCGGSFAEAEESCAASSSADDGGLSLDGATSLDITAAATRYCPTGSSSQCPRGMECYAAVPCPRSTHDEEPPLLQEVSLRLLNSFLVTEPILLNATMGEDRNDSLVDEESSSEWSSFFGESSSSMLGMMSALLSSRYGLN